MKTINNILSVTCFLLVSFGLYGQNTTIKLTSNSDIGNRNILIGDMAGDSLVGTPQSQNTFIGYKAGIKNKRTHNTFIGAKAGMNSTGLSNTLIGSEAGLVTKGSNSVFIGSHSGRSNVSGGMSVYIGTNSGKSIVDKEGCTIIGAFAGEYATEEHNTLIGYGAGRDVQGKKNTLLGARTARYLYQGEENTFLGARAGLDMTTGDRNTLIGVDAAQHKLTGDKNVFIGFESGWENFNGNNNVFIGTQSGRFVTGDNQLYIENSDTITAPLIYGDFEKDKVGINTNDVPDGYVLGVRGNIIAEEIRLKLYGDGWPDYVFQPGYDMLTLEETEQQIETLGHLPGVPSAEEVGKDGFQVGEMNAILLEKIEELTLHMIDINKEVKTLREENQALKNRMDKMSND